MITGFSLTKGLTINTGNYNNVKLEASVAVILLPEETLDAAISDARSALKDMLIAEMTPVMQTVPSGSRRIWTKRMDAAPETFMATYGDAQEPLFEDE